MPSKVEEEWPVLIRSGLDERMNDESLNVDEEPVAEELVPNKVEEEWPSIEAIPGLDQDMSDESAGVDEELVAEELVPNKVEKEWPSIERFLDWIRM